MPDLSSRAGARRSIGLDMDALMREKETFKNEIIVFDLHKTTSGTRARGVTNPGKTVSN